MKINHNSGIVVGAGGRIEGGAIVTHGREVVPMKGEAPTGLPEPITILFLSADPINADPLQVQQEMREIAQELRLSDGRDRFTLCYQFAARPADISRALLVSRPRLVHFSGHGTRSGSLSFQNASGEAQPVDARALTALFSQFTDNIECVLLNACYSSAQAEAIVETVPYVIGMTTEIGDMAAIAFSVGFLPGSWVRPHGKRCVCFRLRSASASKHPGESNTGPAIQEVTGRSYSKDRGQRSGILQIGKLSALRTGKAEGLT